MIVRIAFLLVLLCLSGFFSGSETALFSLGSAKLRGFKRSKSPTKRLIARTMENPARLLATLLLGNTLVNIAASSLGENIISVFLQGKGAVGISTLTMTLLILLFGEITPKTIAVQRPERVASWVVRPLNVFSTLVSPIRRLLRRTTELLLSLLGVSAIGESRELTEEELQTLVDIGFKEGVVNRLEREIIQRVFSFGDKTVQQVMTPRVQVVALCVDTPPREALKILRSRHYSRAPVYEGQEDRIVGSLHIKDFVQKPDAESLRDLIRPVRFVPETRRIDSLFRELRATKQHFCVVIDEYGVYCGIVTMDDLLEEIVGEAFSALPRRDLFRRIGPNAVLVKGVLELDVFNRKMGTSLKDPNAQSIGGYVVNRLGRIPETKERLRIGDLEFEVVKAQPNRIVRMLVKRVRKRGARTSE
ncbi:MAG: HlyC/CorC family transporter [Deltaproteobacteria bacterium]|nr:HlyC/CorC family transporter [Deltaproteobacteria bacterium]